jgi:hypothetical protein
MRKIPVSMVTPRQRVRVGNRTLSKDEWSAVQTLNDATDGDIPAVRSKPPLAAANRALLLLNLTSLCMQSS